MNAKPLLARLELMDRDTRDAILKWMDVLAACGYDVPTAKGLIDKLKQRAKRKANQCVSS